MTISEQPWFSRVFSEAGSTRDPDDIDWPSWKSFAGWTVANFPDRYREDDVVFLTAIAATKTNYRAARWQFSWLVDLFRRACDLAGLPQPPEAPRRPKPYRHIARHAAQ